MKIEFPLLTPDDIEVKVKQITAKGAVALLYKTARVDMEMLDRVVGCMNWQRESTVVNGNLYCTISIWDEDKKQWVSKQDCGVESREDGEGNEKKGESSDAFKRAGFCWGIGRELYSSPFTFLKVQTEEDGQYNGKKRYKLANPFQKFAVSEIGYDNRKVSRLVIVDKDTKNIVFEYGTKPVEQKTNKAPKKAEKQPEQAVETQTVEKVPSTGAYDKEGRYKAFVTHFGLTTDDFTSMRKKAMEDPEVNIPNRLFKELTPDEWEETFKVLSGLIAKGYFK